MVAASDLRAGMIVQHEGRMFRVLAAEYRAGGGKMPGTVHARLQALPEGAVTNRRFRPDEKVPPVDVERQTMEFLYQDGDAFYFIREGELIRIEMATGKYLERVRGSDKKWHTTRRRCRYAHGGRTRRR